MDGEGVLGLEAMSWSRNLSLWMGYTKHKLVQTILCRWRNGHTSPDQPVQHSTVACFWADDYRHIAGSSGDVVPFGKPQMSCQRYTNQQGRLVLEKRPVLWTGTAHGGLWFVSIRFELSSDIIAHHSSSLHPTIDRARSQYHQAAAQWKPRINTWNTWIKVGIGTAVLVLTLYCLCFSTSFALSPEVVGVCLWVELQTGYQHFFHSEWRSIFIARRWTYCPLFDNSFANTIIHAGDSAIRFPREEAIFVSKTDVDGWVSLCLYVCPALLPCVWWLSFTLLFGYLS